MKVKDILRRKGAAVHTISAEASVDEALNRLVSLTIGCLVVLDQSGNMTGLISERDIIIGCARYGESVTRMPVCDVMNAQPATASLDHDLDDLMEIMTNSRVRHIPILADGMLAGLISIGDAVKAQVETLEYENHHMRDYVFGR